MELGQWAGLAIMLAMGFGLIVWIVYVMKKDKKKRNKTELWATASSYRSHRAKPIFAIFGSP